MVTPQKSENMTSRKGLKRAATMIVGDRAATAWPSVTCAGDDRLLASGSHHLSCRAVGD